MNLTNYIGKKVIIRAAEAGVFYGTLTGKEGNEVELKDCRRIWYWNGAASISELAVNGTAKPGACKFTVAVPQMQIMGVIEIIPCTDEAQKSIEGVWVWKIS